MDFKMVGMRWGDGLWTVEAFTCTRDWMIINHVEIVKNYRTRVAAENCCVRVSMDEHRTIAMMGYERVLHWDDGTPYVAR